MQVRPFLFARYARIFAAFALLSLSIYAEADTDAVQAAETARNYEILAKSMKKADCTGVGDTNCGTATNPAATSSSSNTATKSSTPDPAYDRAKAAVAACESSASAVNGNACSTDSSNPAMADAYNSVQNDSSSQTSGTSETCGKPGGSASKASSALSQVRGTCQSAYSSCSSACSSAASSASGYSDLSARVAQARATCNSASSKLSGIDAGIAQTNQTSSSSSQCQKEVNDGNNSASGNDQIRDRSGCSDPAFAAQNPACGSQSATTNLQSAAQGTGSEDGDSFGGGSSGNQASSNPDAADPSKTAGLVDGIRGSADAIRPDSGAEMNGFLGSSANAAPKNTKLPPGAEKSPRFGSTSFAGFGAGKNAGSLKANGSWIPDKVGDRKTNDMPPNLDRFRPGFMMRGLASDQMDPKMWVCGKASENIWENHNRACRDVMNSSNPLSLNP